MSAVDHLRHSASTLASAKYDGNSKNFVLLAFVLDFWKPLAKNVRPVVFAILGIMIDKNIGDIVECQAAVPDQRDYHVVFEVRPVLIWSPGVVAG